MNVSFMQVQIIVQKPCRKATKILTKPATVVHPAQSRLIKRGYVHPRLPHVCCTRCLGDGEIAKE